MSLELKIELMEILNKYASHISAEDFQRIGELLNALSAREPKSYVS